MEDCGTSDPSREPQEENMDEMSRLIRNLTNKMSRFKIENRNVNKSPQEGGIINPKPTQFIILPNPQLMRRDRRNEEQPLHPPVKKNNDNNFIEELVDEGYDEYIEEIHLLQDDIDVKSPTTHVESCYSRKCFYYILNIQ
jgi:hypothetical protein